MFFHNQEMLPLPNLDSPGHRLRHFCTGENAARIQLVMACITGKPDTAQMVELVALAQWAGRPGARR